MAKQKKYPKLPNGYGSIKKLSGNRRNPFAVYPPATELIAPGQYAPVKAICYVDDYMKGFSVLTAYHAGTYYPGFERTLNHLKGNPDALLADYNQAFRKNTEVSQEKLPTFAEVYERFYNYKYVDSGKKYSEASLYSTRAAFKNCSAIHKRTFAELRHDDLQGVLDDCELKHSSLELILSLLHQMYSFAEIYELADKDYSAHLQIKKEEDDEHGVPFTDAELKILWDNKDDEIIEMILIMCYSGFRIKAYKTLKVDLKKKYFQGGVKTAAGKDRIVPIHSGIHDLVIRRIRRSGSLLNISTNAFRQSMYDALSRAGVERHTPHDCRHTFSRLCEKYNVNENDRKRMLGHAFNGDITNSVYGHRDLDDLREEIEKIKIS